MLAADRIYMTYYKSDAEETNHLSWTGFLYSVHFLSSVYFIFFGVGFCLYVVQISLDNILKITLIYEKRNVNKCLMQTDIGGIPQRK